MGREENAQSQPTVEGRLTLQYIADFEMILNEMKSFVNWQRIYLGTKFHDNQSKCSSVTVTNVKVKMEIEDEDRGIKAIVPSQQAYTLVSHFIIPGAPPVAKILHYTNHILCNFVSPFTLVYFSVFVFD